MRDVDASSIVYGWDNYPIDQFPALWDWIAEQIKDGRLAISRVAFDEVSNVSPDCAEWLYRNDISRREITNEIIAAALAVKNLLGINNDAYSAKGVGENDVLIRKEIPRLCRGGSKRLTYQGVHRGNSRP